MLISLQIRDFAIIDHAEVEFPRGMTVLTGETGAGKSILVDALGLVLGERGGSGLVRSGAKRAEFSARFDLDDLPQVNNWLQEQELDLDDECLLRRVISADGRSRAFINGAPVPLQSLKTLGEKLLDIHGQHFHQSLGRSAVQRNLLDHFGKHQDLLTEVESAHDDWHSLTSRLAEIEDNVAERASRIELLSFQLAELDALDLRDEEYEELQAERQILQNSGRLSQGIAGVLQGIFDADEGNAQSLIADACQTLESLGSVDEKLQPVLEMLQDATIQVTEASDMLRRYGDALPSDPARRELVEDRLDAIRAIGRKHRIEVDAIPAFGDRLRSQLEELQHADELGVDLNEQVARAATRYFDAAAGLSNSRQATAVHLAADVTAAMIDLGMPGGVFEIAIKSRAEENARRDGIDDIEYLISANPGQPLMPLSKVASGGELSRMSLAVQVIASDGSSIPTMIFDEVDSGVGGGVAEMVGRRLQELGESRQVLCVTHLPQVASQASSHFRVTKQTDKGSTRTRISLLDQAERIDELARMLGGVKITQRTRDHAAEMLNVGGAHRRAGSRA